MKISATVLLFFIFLTLKLTGTIAWSWWWVTCPLWIGLAVFLVICCAVTLISTGMFVLSFFSRK